MSSDLLEEFKNAIIVMNRLKLELDDHNYSHASIEADKVINDLKESILIINSKSMNRDRHISKIIRKSINEIEGNNKRYYKFKRNVDDSGKVHITFSYKSDLYN